MSEENQDYTYDLTRKEIRRSGVELTAAPYDFGPCCRVLKDVDVFAIVQLQMAESWV